VKLLGAGRFLEPILSTRLLYGLYYICMTSWIMCILGFGGWLPSFLFGVTTAFLFAVSSGCVGTSHRWLLPAFTCLFIALTPAHHEYSLDALLSRYIDNYPFPPVRTPLQSSAVGRTFVLVMAISTLFSGAVAKLKNSGLRWMNGKSLAYYVGVDRKKGQQNGSSEFFKRMIGEVPLVAIAMSVSSIILEGGSIVAIFFPITRWPLVIAASGFHIGIWLSMSPNYFPQIVCYVLCVPWWWETKCKLSTAQLSDFNLLLGVDVVFAVCVLSYIAGIVGLEYWPVTCIPMYSFYRDQSFSPDHFTSVEQCKLVADEFVHSGLQSIIAWADGWVGLRLVALGSENEKEDKKELAKNIDLGSYICDPKAAAGVMWKQYRVILCNPVARDVSALKDNTLKSLMELANNKESQTSKMLQTLRPFLKKMPFITTLPDWVHSPDIPSALQVFVRVDGRIPIVLSSVPWHTDNENGLVKRSNGNSPHSNQATLSLKNATKSKSKSPKNSRKDK